MNGALVGFIYITADYFWYLGGGGWMAQSRIGAQRRMLLNAGVPSESATQLLQSDSVIRVPANYDPGEGYERSICVAADLRGHI